MNSSGFSLEGFLGGMFYAVRPGGSAGFFIIGHNLNNFSCLKQVHKKTLGLELSTQSNDSEV